MMLSKKSIRLCKLYLTHLKEEYTTRSVVPNDMKRESLKVEVVVDMATLFLLKIYLITFSLVMICLEEEDARDSNNNKDLGNNIEEMKMKEMHKLKC
jgi:hypothetical protein